MTALTMSALTALVVTLILLAAVWYVERLPDKDINRGMVRLMLILTIGAAVTSCLLMVTAIEYNRTHPIMSSSHVTVTCHNGHIELQSGVPLIHNNKPVKCP